MKKFIVIIIFSTLISCKTEKSIDNISCAGKVTIQYDRKKSDDEQVVKKDTKGYTVYFINEFDDQIEAYINGKLYFDKHIKIEDNSDDLSNYFGFNVVGTKIPILKIISKTQNTCLDIRINEKYKLIYVFLSREGKWIARFSNIYYII